MRIKNEIMLITYPDSLGKNLEELQVALHKYLKDVVRGIHILPFYPSSADRGFSPMTYEKVDEQFGSWTQLEALSQDYFLMYDFMINHISRSSPYFQDYLEKKDESKYKDYFINYSDFWDNGEPTKQQVDKIYKRKPRAPFIIANFKDGTQEKIWCTFDEEQIDLDIRKEATLDFIKKTIEELCQRGASVLRIDAFAYVTKKPDTNCFFVEPETWEILDYVKAIAEQYDVAILPEIHEHYSIQMKLAKKGHWVYDFALPMLVLYSLYSGDNQPLVNWLSMAPKKQFTTLDTHDGIGVVDVKDLMTEDQITYTKDSLYSKGANVKKVYSSEKYKNLDIYQINCSYYSALGNHDQAYLLSRAIQFFAPGIPQVYYMGLLAGENDIELLEATKIGRNINRHYYSLEEIEREVQRPVVKKLFKLMKFRNEFKVFNGEMMVYNTEQHLLKIKWEQDHRWATLEANLRTLAFTINYYDGQEQTLVL